ncbi:MAG: NAD(P)H-dependent oxidoreductase subunit E [Acidobacteria bacterium]|nr:NAD(P)H-dependent oxidoreductase subunit E [Acidobacteriota bacterium]
MDLRLGAEQPTEEERSAVDGEVGSGERHRLLPVLHALQSRIGWISPGAVNHVAARLMIPPAEVFGVASFYGMFSLEPRPARAAQVCDDIACLIQGAAPQHPHVGCLGLCDRWGQPPALHAGRLLYRVGKADPASLRDYIRHAGYKALAKALEMGPDSVIREVLASKLLGRGGAAFPAGKKWQAVRASASPTRYVVCNADESEPGTFKDRVVMEGDPFAVIESMTIAGFAIGAECGYLYVRGEYPLAAERLTHAIHEARAHGVLGGNILGRGLSFDIELRRGAGAYICGEETALFNSIEGYRGEPRNKPPYPTEAGLFGQPTLVNNVETLINVPGIVLDGGAAYAAIGTAYSTGTKLYCLSGHVARSGVYEAVFGATLRELIEMAGGVAGSGRLQAVLLGGAAGAFVSPQELDTPLTFEGTRAIGASLGSAVVMLFDDTVDLKKILLRIAAFFREESCGQCVPCRIGTVRQEELLDRGGQDAIPILREVGQAMRDASICGLGQTASSAIESALNRGLLHE